MHSKQSEADKKKKKEAEWQRGGTLVRVEGEGADVFIS